MVKQNTCIYSFGDNPLIVLKEAREWLGQKVVIQEGDDSKKEDNVNLVYITSNLLKELKDSKDPNKVGFFKLRTNYYGLLGEKVLE